MFRWHFILGSHTWRLYLEDIMKRLAGLVTDVYVTII
jgi:hypothetical protein